MTVVGARPQFIKAAIVSNELRKYVEIEEYIVHTGQHFDENMSDIFFNELKIPMPKVNLGVHSMSESNMIASMMTALEDEVIKVDPKTILVYGDTNSTLATALVASKLNIPLIHVEAGVRCGNLNISEEINRIVTDRLSDLLFAPTKLAVDNLKSELTPSQEGRIIFSGDVMKDAYLEYNTGLKKSKEDFGIPSQNYVLATIHRRETVSNEKKLREVIDALNEIQSKKEVIFPMHPHTSQYIRRFKIKTDFNVIDPVGYLDMLNFLEGADLIITDSGGLNREAFFAGKKSLVVREETEWPELVNMGYSMLTCCDKNEILYTYEKIQNIIPKIDNESFGDGRASYLIARSILEHYY